jgi:hypothetical protein
VRGAGGGRESAMKRQGHGMAEALRVSRDLRVVDAGFVTNVLQLCLLVL